VEQAGTRFSLQLEEKVNRVKTGTTYIADRLEQDFSESTLTSFIQREKKEGDDLSFDASNSEADPIIEDNSLEYRWDFDTTVDSNGDGDPTNDVDAQGVSASYLYPDVGNINVQLTVEDVLHIRDNVTRVVRIGKKEDVQGQRLESLKVRSPNQAISTLDVLARDSILGISESTDIEVTLLNGDGSVKTTPSFGPRPSARLYS